MKDSKNTGQVQPLLNQMPDKTRSIHANISGRGSSYLNREYHIAHDSRYTRLRLEQMLLWRTSSGDGRHYRMPTQTAELLGVEVADLKDFNATQTGGAAWHRIVGAGTIATVTQTIHKLSDFVDKQPKKASAVEIASQIILHSLDREAVWHYWDWRRSSES